MSVFFDATGGTNLSILVAVGAGLTVQPNAVLALRRIGLDRAVTDAGRVSRRGRLLATGVHWPSASQLPVIRSKNAGA